MLHGPPQLEPTTSVQCEHFISKQEVPSVFFHNLLRFSDHLELLRCYAQVDVAIIRVLRQVSVAGLGGVIVEVNTIVFIEHFVTHLAFTDLLLCLFINHEALLLP